MTGIHWQEGVRIKGVYLPPGSSFRPVPGIERIEGEGPHERWLIEIRGELVTQRAWARGLLIELLMESNEDPGSHVLSDGEERPRLPPQAEGRILRGAAYAAQSPRLRLVFDAQGRGEPTITLQGLEHVRNQDEVRRLLPAIRLFRDWHSAGRPRLEDEKTQDWRVRALRAIELKKKHPGWSWKEISSMPDVATYVRNLRRWRDRLKAESGA